MGMSEATGPLPAIGGTAGLIAAVDAGRAEVREAQALLRELAAGGAVPPVEVIELSGRIAEWDRALRKAAMWADADPVLSTAPLAAVPEPPRRRQRPGGTHRQRPPGDRPLMFRVPGIAAAAFLALKGAANAHRITAAAMAATGSVALGGALVTAVPAITHPAAASPGVTYATAPAWHTSAVPLTPRQARYAAEVTRAAKRRHGHGLTSAASVLPALAPYTPAPPSPPPSPSQPPQAQGPATLEIPATSVDLSAVSQAMITLTATGDGGWVSWHVTTGGTDLDFSATRGVLQAGQSYELTVSLDAAQDGNTEQTFAVNGAEVTVYLPVPAAVPSPAATPTDTATPVPTGEAPSPGSS